MSYIDKIKKGSTTYDINDTRIPTPVASKILGTDSSGNIEWQNAPQGGGGTQLYKHAISCTIESDSMELDIISLTSTQYDSADAVGRDFVAGNILSGQFSGSNVNLLNTKYSSGTWTIYAFNGEDGQIMPVEATFVSDTVTSL